MKSGGWKGLATVQIYLRPAGIEVQGATESLSFLNPVDTIEKVTDIFDS